MASITPVRPPHTKTMKKPLTNSIGSRQRGVPLASVPSQANTWTAVGTATATLASEKNASARCGMPTVNMWCTQMPMLRNTMPTMATITAT